MCAAKLVRTTSPVFSRTFSGRRCAYSAGTSSVRTLISAGAKSEGKNRYPSRSNCCSCWGVSFMAGKADSVRTILYALGANLAIAAAKTAAAIFTGSSAMLAEAIHSFADSGNQLLLLWGIKQAKRPPSPDYPLGWGKAIYFWSFIVALVLFSLGGLFSLYEGWHKLAQPEPLKYAWVAVGILVFGLVAETVSLRACLHEVNKVRGNRTLWRWFRESRQSELVVILGEDLAALLGLALALAAVLITIATGNPRWDALGSMSIGVVLIVVAACIGYEIKGLLIG